MKTDTYERYITPKTKAGGMSAKRYDKLRTAQMEKFYKEAAEFIKNKIMPNIDNIDVIVFGGNIIRAQEFLDRNLLPKEIVDKIADKLVSTSMVNDYGIEEAKKKLPEILKDSQFAKEKEVWDKWLEHLAKEDGLAIYGADEIAKYMEYKQIEKVICLDNYDIDVKYDPEEYNYVLIYLDNGSPYAEQLKAFGGRVGILRWKSA